MKRITLIISLILLIPSFYGQKRTLLDSVEKIESNFEKNDSLIIYKFKSEPNIRIIINKRRDEFFDYEDTLKRDYLDLENQIIVIDAINGLMQNDYSGAYDLLNCYMIKTTFQKYLILSFVDVFLQGSNQHVFYTILKLENNIWTPLSIYRNEAGMPIETIKLIKKRHTIKLLGKYLKEIKKLPDYLKYYKIQ